MTEITAPQSEVVLIEAQGEVAVIVPQQQAVVVEVRRGPPGKDGIGILPAGENTGDIIRYNAVTEEWESCAEPFEFQGIVLVPMTLPGSPVEGFVGYNAADNGLYVAVE
jgi:hypothetical protein